MIALSPEPRSLEPVEQYALRLGDDALLLSHRLSEWLTHAPDLEEEVALANVALDLLGQARHLLTLAGRSIGRDEDDLAYGRTAHEYRNALLVELPNGDFAHMIVRLLVFSAYQCALYDALRDSADPELAAFAGKARAEVAFHREYAAGWVVRLGDGTEESHRRTAAALAELWPYATELFARDEVVSELAAQGVVPDPEALQGNWLDAVQAVFTQATLGVVPAQAQGADMRQPGDGRQGSHSHALGQLLAEMNSVRLADPGAVW
jgi:ring-1,2-phenylacetyl-CoA epoxidase subunit PaaC